ncbi:ferritin-like fold-containing protein [Micromonospora sp. NPDC049274]|uniref:ferritin-like fold-containing protein n=1 Tax=Micromonospora sp. NPDC049274 TaxID=3154829 RepID=UPI00341C13B4
MPPEEALTPGCGRCGVPRLHARDGAEMVSKAYVGDAITDDFSRESPTRRTSPTALVLNVLHDSRYAQFSVAEIPVAVADDPRVAGRLSMWVRRLAGEALSQAGRVAAERAALTALISRGDRVDVPGLFGRLSAAHTARMAVAGLNN